MFSAGKRKSRFYILVADVLKYNTYTLTETSTNATVNKKNNKTDCSTYVRMYTGLKVLNINQQVLGVKRRQGCSKLRLGRIICLW